MEYDIGAQGNAELPVEAEVFQHYISWYPHMVHTNGISAFNIRDRYLEIVMDDRVYCRALSSKHTQL